MRALFFAIAVTAVACGFPTSNNTPANPCGTGTQLVNGVCEPDQTPQTPVTITIESSLYDNLPGCYIYSPNPASVTVNQSFRFLNNSPITLTILGVGASTPWVTVAPGQTSAALSFSSAAIYSYFIGGCGNGAVGDYYGQIDVTIG